MKRTGFFVIIFLCASLYAQNNVKESSFKWLSWSVLAGPGITSAPETGYSFILEGHAEFLPGLSVKLSGGYSSLNKGETIGVKSYELMEIDGKTYYRTYSYNAIIENYEIFPVAVGVEYALGGGAIAPYLTFEAGKNIYTTGMNYSGYIFDDPREYTGRNDIPAKYRSGREIVLNKSSMRTALGAGVRVKLLSNISLEIRYLYTINTEIINSHQILFGVFI